MTSKLRVAVIGAGRLGGFHAQKMAANPHVELIGIVDPLAANRDRVAEQCHTRALADCGELLDRLDAAVIAAPTKLHHRLAADLLRRGIHLLVEKPLCATVAEADELVQIAKRNKAVLQVGHVERFNPAFTAAGPHLEEPKYIEAVRASGFTFRSTDVGVVLDLMIHDIDLVLSMARCGVRRVEALGLSVLGGHEDVANARLHFENGCVAALSASRVSYEPMRRMSAFSHTAFAAIDFATRTVNLVRPSETLLQRQFDVDALSPEQVEHYKQNLTEEHLPRDERQYDAVDALALESEDFVSAVRKGQSPLVTGEAGRDALAVAEQILDSIENHAWDDSHDGPVGPLATPRPRIIPAPHFSVAPDTLPVVRKEAG